MTKYEGFFEKGNIETYLHVVTLWDFYQTKCGSGCWWGSCDEKHSLFLFKIQAKPQHFCPSCLGIGCLSFETPSLWRHFEASRNNLLFFLPGGKLGTRTVRLKDAWPGCWSKGTSMGPGWSSPALRRGSCPGDVPVQPGQAETMGQRPA